MILSDRGILAAMTGGDIIIEPFDKSNLGGNSYDVHLSKHFAQYTEEIIDAAKDNPLHRFDIPREGFIMRPRELYLGSTVEYTATKNYVPMLEGKSGVGRLGTAIHVTAGFGDEGFQGHWTLELFCVQPVRIYPGMPIGQIFYHTLDQEVQRSYMKKSGGSYTDDRNPLPQGSRLYRKAPFN